MPFLRRTLRNPESWALGLGLAALAWFLVTRFVAVFTEAINWDEFALMARADRSLRLGVVDGGGRPGLVTVALVPFVRGCVDSVQAVVNARILWQFITLAYLAGVYVLVRRWIEYSRDRVAGCAEAALAVALLALLPAFVTWSVQVRTDQAALAAATWGSVLLLAPRTRDSIAAGALFAIAILSTQKALYVIALGGVLFLAAVAARAAAGGALRRELSTAATRTTLAAAGFAALVGAYFLMVPSVANIVSPSAVGSSFATMDWYRDRLGFRVYSVNAPRLWVHWLLFGVLLHWTWRVLKARESPAYPRLATCWATLALGVAVAAVHGSSFGYFLMTAGVFPAVALALAAGPALAKLRGRAPLATAALVVLLAAQSAPEAIEMLAGGQSHQRATMTLVTGTPLRHTRGYQVEGALFCARDPDPMPAMFTQQILLRARQGPAAFDEFLGEFRSRPIAFIVESHRMGQFPPLVRRFWEEHYVPYAAALLVAGFRIPAGRPESARDVIVPGDYRWIPEGAREESAISVNGTRLAPGELIHLAKGSARVSGPAAGTGGILALDLGPILPSEPQPFYDMRQWHQLRGFK
jgi:predicted regulator of Ras-like GTPase activity (Roadblock/LC7/MglB family)